MDSLPSNITIEDIFNGRSESRNRVVTTIFKELNLIEQWGSDIQRIVNSCKKYGLATPEIQEKNYFRLLKSFAAKKIHKLKRTKMNVNERLRTITND